MRRCFELARRGKGFVSPNPMVGALLTYEDRIIGEGYHEQYGQSHAEVQAIESVRPEDRDLISESTLYVSLEPCNHFGKTPPCTDRILREGIPKVVLSVKDPSPAVGGQSIAQLREMGVDVTTGVLEREGHELIRVFETAICESRPYIQLKYAVSRDGFIGKQGKQIWLSATYMSPLVHRWRHEADAILVGRKTAEIDDPALTNRSFYGHSPLRLVIDKSLQIPSDYQIYNDIAETVVFNAEKEDKVGNTRLHALDFNRQIIPQIAEFLIAEQRHCLMVEGGARTIRYFLQSGYWDEAIIMEADKFLGSGIEAPIPSTKPLSVYSIGKERVFIYRNHAENQ